MKINKLLLISFFALAQYSFGQVKIGNDINTIHSSSILELESTDKVLILTRVTNAQMAAITPLTGAMVYNTDENCMFQYNGILWQSLCDTSSFNETNTVIFDNNDGTFSYTNENNVTVTITKSQLTDNGDGTFSYANGNGTPVNFTGTDSQAISTDGTSGNLTLENGGSVVLNVDDADADASNEINTGFTLNGTALEITDADGTLSQDLDGTFVTETELTANNTATTNAINAVQADVDANETAATNAIAAVQNDVDANETAATNAITALQNDKEDAANKSTNVALGTSDDAFPTQNAVKTYVDAQITASNSADGDTDATNEINTGFTLNGTALEITDADGTLSQDLDGTFVTETELTANNTATTNAINAVQADVDANETAATNAIAAVQTDVDANETAATNAITALQNDKEDAANKSTNVALGTSDDAFPTQNAVKTYVDAQITASNSADGDTDATNEINTGFTLNGTALEITDADGTLSQDLDGTFVTETELTANNTATTNAINAVQTDVDTNEADADAAIALKEDAANKSDDVNLADATNTKFPTELAVKTYVDAQITASNSADGDTDATNEINTGFTLNGTALEITDADGTLSQDLDGTFVTETELTANNTATTNAIAAVQTDVDANEADADAAIALKEDAANKSTNVALGTSDDAFPTQNAVKTYVDTQVAASTQVIVSADANNDVTTGADGGAFYDDATLQTNIANNATAITTETTRATNAESAIQADVDANETAATNAIAAVQTDVDTNEADADAAIALKEDAANKSTNVALGTSDDAFPTQNAVKTYVDTQVAASTQVIVSADANNDVTAGADGGAFYDDATLQTNIANNATAITTETTRATNAENAIQADVDANETAATNAIAAVQADVDANETAANDAIDLKEDAANKSDATDLGNTSPSSTLFPTQNAVKTYVDAQANGNITSTDIDVTGGTNAAFENVSLSIADNAIIASKIADDNVTLDKLANGTSNGQIMRWNGTNWILDNETVSKLESPAGSENSLVFTDEINGVTTIPNIVRSVNGVNPAANGNVAVVLSSVSTGLESARPVTGVDSDIYIVSGEVAPNTDRNGVAFIYDDPTGWQEVTTDLSTNDARYVNIIGDAMTGPLTMGGNAVTSIANPVNPQDATSKSYVDAQIIASTQVIVSTDANNDITTGADGGAFYDDATLQTNIANNATAINTETTRATNAENAIQADVDANEIAATNAIDLKEDAANKSTNVALGTSDDAFPTQNAVKTYVDAQVAASNQVIVSTDANNNITAGADGGAFYDDATLQTNIANNATAITTETTRATNAENAIQADVDANETAATNAIAAVQTDVDANEADADAAIALKEDAANKSTNVALGTSDDAFPTQNAVKTYVDAQVAASTQVIVSADANNDVTAGADGGAFYDDATLQTNIANNATAITTETTRATNAENAIQADVDANETAATNAIAAVQADVDANETAANDAIDLKEDAANKSTNVALGTSDDAFPTQNAVKTYVDAQITASNSADGDTDATNEINTGFTLNGTALEITDADGTLSQDLDGTFVTETELTANNTATTNAINAVQTDVDTNEADADAAIALKEDAANKSDDVNLADATNTKFPTELAVKTYVDAQITASNSADGDTDATNEINTGFTLNGTALEITDADGTLSQDLDGTFVTETELTANNTATTNAINAVQTDVDTNEADADAAIALKEDAANKSTNVALGTSDDAFPTQNAVKTYVDAQITASNSADGDTDATNEINTGFTLNGTALEITDADGTLSQDLDGTFVTETELTANNTATTNAIAAVQTDVDTNEADADAAIALKEDLTNKSDATDLGDTTPSSSLYPTQNAVKTYVDTQISGIIGGSVTNLSQDDTSGVISYVNESAITQTAEVISTDTNNDITPGTDGGAFYNSMVKAIGKVNALGVVLKGTTGVTVVKQVGVGHYRVNLPAGTVSDANYIIQLSQPGRAGVGNDDPGISYSNQTATGFDVIMGDNDNGGSDRARFDSEFMFVILDL
ncbi:beta strand repeat-containing protein [Cellulophaga lytica]